MTTALRALASAIAGLTTVVGMIVSALLARAAKRRLHAGHHASGQRFRVVGDWARIDGQQSTRLRAVRLEIGQADRIDAWAYGGWIQAAPRALPSRPVTWVVTSVCYQQLSTFVCRKIARDIKVLAARWGRHRLVTGNSDFVPIGSEISGPRPPRVFLAREDPRDVSWLRVL